jgi:hypothetical protein
MTQQENLNARNIPLPIQRQIRQRCGFGCVICGMPLYEYEHLPGWANVKRHVAEEITLLCDQHHREKTNGLLPLQTVVAANKDPHNLREGVSKPYSLHYAGEECEAVVGDNRFTTRDNGYGTVCVPLCIDGIPLLGFILADGHLLLNLNLFDEANQLILQIQNNQLVQSVEPWDIELKGRNLIVRVASRQILIDLEFEVPNRILVRRGRFLLNGVEVLIRPDHLLLTNNMMLVAGSQARNVAVGVAIGTVDPPEGCAIRLEGVRRYLGNREEAARWAREALKQAVPNASKTVSEAARRNTSPLTETGVE